MAAGPTSSVGRRGRPGAHLRCLDERGDRGFARSVLQKAEWVAAPPAHTIRHTGRVAGHPPDEDPYGATVDLPPGVVAPPRAAAEATTITPSRTVQDPVTLPQAGGSGGDEFASFASGLQAGPGPIARVEALREIGKGGMGRVLAVRDPALGREVALKQALIRDPDDAPLARFVREAQITAQLEHPNIVPLYDAGLTPDGEPWYAMRRVKGRTLAEVLDEPGDEWSLQRLLGAFVQVCNAVAFAHDRGVLHRDLKPDNIMLGRYGEVLLLDWGVARLIDAAGLADTLHTTPVVLEEQPDSLHVPHTMDGAAIGTPGYMSPEAARGDLDEMLPASDVFGLGAILYELLTRTKAYRAEGLLALLFLCTQGPPEDPRERAPERNLPEEICAIALRALQTEPADRFPTGRELGEAVQSFLEGRHRREQAEAQMQIAQQAWAGWRAIGGRRADLGGRLERLEDSTPKWLPLDQKAELVELRQRVQDLEGEAASTFEAAVSAAELALTFDPRMPEAHTLLADAYWTRFVTAESAGDREEEALLAGRVRAHDDGRYAALLEGVGALSLRTEPPGAEVVLQRFTQRGPVWALGSPRPLGRTPLEAEPLAMGSYRLTLRAGGCEEVVYPVHIGRGRHWGETAPPVRLPARGSTPPGCVHVAEGPFVCGGDPDAQDGQPRSEPWVDAFAIRIFPVTMAEYATFLTALARVDPEQAWGRVPRNPSTATKSDGQYWPRPDADEPYVVPAVDQDGDPWDARWPVMGITWEDAQAFVSWRRAVDRLPWRLPSELEWEKATRGVDGRLFPWGGQFDASLCRMRHSREGRPHPEAIGSFASDVSVYGVRDLAGNMAGWCGDERYGADPTRRAQRGGAWTADGNRCRATWRQGFRPDVVRAVTGFRLVCSPPT